MNKEMKWYAVYTKSRCEKKVAEFLTKKSIENYCPLNRTVKIWADRKKTVMEPLFSLYVFVRADSSAHVQILRTDGVLNFVYWLGKPAVIRDEEIEAIRAFTSEYSDVKLERMKVNVADKVRIVEGPLAVRDAHVLQVFNKTVRVSLPSLGYSLTAEISKTRIEVISSVSVKTAGKTPTYKSVTI